MVNQECGSLTPPRSWSFGSARSFAIPFNHNPAPDDPISVTRAEYDAVYDHLGRVGLPRKADRDQANRVSLDTISRVTGALSSYHLALGIVLFTPAGLRTRCAIPGGRRHVRQPRCRRASQYSRCADIGDQALPSRSQHPHRFRDGPGVTSRVGDAVDGRAADHLDKTNHIWQIIIMISLNASDIRSRICPMTPARFDAASAERPLVEPATPFLSVPGGTRAYDDTGAAPLVICVPSTGGPGIRPLSGGGPEQPCRVAG